MRDRLIELLKNFADGTYTSNGKIVEGTKVDDIADLILADGWMRPPCKVGYYIWFFKNDRLAFGQVEDITISRNGLYAFVFEVDEEDEVIGEWTVPLCEFGKTVFLTKEEAEQSLRKDEGK